MRNTITKNILLALLVIAFFILAFIQFKNEKIQANSKKNETKDFVESNDKNVYKTHIADIN